MLARTNRTSLRVVVVSLVLATCSSLAAQTNHGMVARYGTTGALNGSFVTPGSASLYYVDLLLQGDGRITTAASIENASGSTQLLSRFTAQGQYDTSFGWLGIATANYPGGSNYQRVNDIAF